MTHCTHLRVASNHLCLVLALFSTAAKHQSCIGTITSSLLACFEACHGVSEYQCHVTDISQAHATRLWMYLKTVGLLVQKGVHDAIRRFSGSESLLLPTHCI